MYDLVIFGGTEEGRLLAEFAATLPLKSCVCVATEYGRSLLNAGGGLTIRQGRLNGEEMIGFLREAAPRLVLDATHPYAHVVSENIQSVCQTLGLPLRRLVRQPADLAGCRCFSRMEQLIDYLNSNGKTIFSTTGAKEMLELTHVRDFQSRVWLRMLPAPAELSRVIEAGYPAKHLICMQGPFPEELNLAMFRSTGCQILVTKESGAVGGFLDKLNAARNAGMEVCVLLRPRQEQGVDLQEAKSIIRELCV